MEAHRFFTSSCWVNKFLWNSQCAPNLLSLAAILKSRKRWIEWDEEPLSCVEDLVSYVLLNNLFFGFKVLSAVGKQRLALSSNTEARHCWLYIFYVQKILKRMSLDWMVFVKEFLNYKSLSKGAIKLLSVVDKQYSSLLGFLFEDGSPHVWLLREQMQKWCRCSSLAIGDQFLRRKCCAT